jgi:hypothetical protein
MPVGVYEAWHDEHVRGVNDFGVSHPQVWPNRSDFRAFDQDIGSPKVAKLLINGDDAAVLE